MLWRHFPMLSGSYHAVLILNLDGDGGRLNPFCEDRATAEKTFRFLCATIRPRVIYPGHGEVIRGGENTLLGVRTLK